MVGYPLAFFARNPALFLFILARRFDGLISFLVVGVLLDTRLDGRQYWAFFVLLPHGLPVRVSTHFSFSHLLRDVPFCVFRTVPFFFLHLAIA